MSQPALLPGVEPFIFEPSTALVSFRGASLLQPISYKTIHGVPIHVYAQEHPCPAPSYPAVEQNYSDPALREWAKSLRIQATGRKYIDSSLRAWAKGTKTHTTDQNYLCDFRYNRRVYCKGVILPASQTGVVWRQMGLCGHERELYFIHYDDTEIEICDVPAILRCAPRTVFKTLPTKRCKTYRIAPCKTSSGTWETRRISDDIFDVGDVGTSREDVHAITELARKYVEQLRHANQRVGIEPVRTKELQKEWDAYLHMLLKKPTEIIKVKVEGRHITAEQQARAYRKESFREERAGYRSHLFTDDEQGDPGFDRAGDYIANYGQRETEGDHPNDHQERKHWFPWFRGVLNEEGWTIIKWVPEGFTPIGGWTSEREAEIRNHPKFPSLVALYQVLFSGRFIEELDIDKNPNTVAKWLARAKEIKGPLDCIPKSDWKKAIGQYICTIVLNNRGTLKILAPLDGPVGDAEAAFNKERQKARRKAVDNAKQYAKAKRLSKKATKSLIEECVKRIEEAYDGALIMSHRGITINDLDEVTPADVIFPCISRGQPQPRQES